MKQRLFLLIMLFSFVFSSNGYETESGTIDLLKKIVSKYQSNISFSINLESEDGSGQINVDMAWIDDSTAYRKTRLDFLDMDNYSGVAWAWSMKNGKDKKWVTRPNGKKIEVTKNKKIDFPTILPEQSILKGYHVVSDTLNFKMHKCIVIELYKISRGNKRGPFSKLWIGLKDDLIYKIEDFNYRENILLKETVMEYFDDSDLKSSYLKSFPKTITINDFKNKKVSIIKLFDYKINQSFDLQIFDPVDIK